MKEKTFEELLEENKKVELFGEDPYYNPNYVIDIDDVLKLLQQVREATIAECIQAAKEELGVMADSNFIKCVKSLPTDRIKLTENK